MFGIVALSCCNTVLLIQGKQIKSRNAPIIKDAHIVYCIHMINNLWATLTPALVVAAQTMMFPPLNFHSWFNFTFKYISVWYFLWISALVTPKYVNFSFIWWNNWVRHLHVLQCMQLWSERVCVSLADKVWS